MAIFNTFLDSFTESKLKSVLAGDVSDYLDKNIPPQIEESNVYQINLNMDPIPEDLCDKMIEATPSKKQRHTFEAARLLFEALENLPRAIAAQESFWAYLCHTSFYRFVQTDWSLEDKNKNTSSESYIAAHYFCNNGIMRNALASLWWSVKLTIDCNREGEERYILTKKFFSNYSLRVNWLNVVLRIQPALHGALEYMIDHPEIHTEAQIKALAMHLNLLGSTKELDRMGKKYIKEQLNLVHDKIMTAKIEKPSKKPIGLDSTNDESDQMEDDKEYYDDEI